jgi:hypothetical protein
MEYSGTIGCFVRLLLLLFKETIDTFIAWFIAEGAALSEQ